MSTRALQGGDRVEWDALGKVMHGTVETIGGGKDEGLVMVRQDGCEKSRPVTYKRLRDSRKVKPATVSFGGDVA